MIVLVIAPYQRSDKPGTARAIDAIPSVSNTTVTTPNYPQNHSELAVPLISRVIMTLIVACR